MSTPLWGHLYDFILPGARAESAIVVSEDDWNARTRDAVVVPVYREPGTTSGNVRVELDGGLVADCTRVQNVARESLGKDRGVCERRALTRIRIGVRIYLDIEQLLMQSGPRQPISPRSQWWPRQGQVSYAEVPGLSQNKMFCLISDDDWNSRPATAYSAAVRLTSKGRERRSKWEVGVPGGSAVAGHLYSLLHEDIDPSSPTSPRPAKLMPEKLRDIAERLIVLLKLA